MGLGNWERAIHGLHTRRPEAATCSNRRQRSVAGYPQPRYLPPQKHLQRKFMEAYFRLIPILTAHNASSITSA